MKQITNFDCFYLFTDGGFTSKPQTASIDTNISWAMTVALTSVAAVIAALDLFGNVIVIYVIRARTPMRTTIDLLIANLAAADLLMIPVIAYLVKFFYIQFDWFGGIMGQITCHLALLLHALSVLSSVCTLSAISIDRFCAVYFPLKKILTKSRVKLIIALIWLLSIACALPECLAARVFLVKDNYICVPDWKDSALSSANYTLIFVVLSYVSPLVTTTTLYLLIGVRLWRSVAPGHQSEEGIERIKVTRRKPTKMLFCIVLVFALCWLPLQSAELMRRFTPNVYWLRIPFNVVIVLPWFGVANSAINPFIYPIFCEKFRLEFKRILCSLCYKEVYRKKSETSVFTGIVKWNVKGSKKKHQKKENNAASSSTRNTRASLVTAL